MNPRPLVNPNIELETPLRSLQPFESIGEDMFSWKGENYLVIVDRMSGMIFVDKMKKVTSKVVTEKLKQLYLT